MPRISLGLDSSTQGLAAVAVDIESRRVLWEHALDYRADPRLDRFGLGDDYILPSSEPGEANQPVELYFASLDALFEDLARGFPAEGLDPADIVVVNVSGQQHGHVLLNGQAGELFAATGSGSRPAAGLAENLRQSLAVPFARIWRTSCTQEEADHVRRAVGGKQALIGLSGSDAPLRFSAFGIRRTALRHPAEYSDTALIHQISSLLPAALSGRANVPLDWGNACGSSLMDYNRRRWSDELIAATAEGLPGGAAALRSKLPPLGSALDVAGTIAGYFVGRYGLSPRCLIGVGSGDNPQTRVTVDGSLLSLGSSFVIMVETGGGAAFDNRGWANAMYDGLDRPFGFGCRTNGALRWDNVRAEHGFAKGDYAAAEAALGSTPPGNRGRLFLWQKEPESFPVSGILPPTRLGYDSPDFASDYAGIVESGLAAVYLHSRRFTAQGRKLYVTGGPSKSAQVLRRVAAIWRREVVPVEQGGAALGAAVSGACAWRLRREDEFDIAGYAASFTGKRAAVRPAREDMEACHGAGGMLERYDGAEEMLLDIEPE